MTLIPDTIAGLDSPATGTLSAKQYNYLRTGINPDRVRQMQGQSHLEAWDVRRTLIRIFGFGGFDLDTKSLDLVAQVEIPPTQPNGRSRWTVVYKAEVRLVIKDANGREIAHFEDGATGDSVNQPSLGDAHDMALKTALSQALKRCAVNLGDQFGLSLYNKGGTGPVVMGSLVAPVDLDAAPLTPQDAPPVTGGELDDRTANAEPVHVAPPQPRTETPPADLLAADPASAIASLALRCGGVDKVRNTWTEAKNRGLVDDDVRVVVPIEAVTLLSLPPLGPLTLGDLLKATGTWVAGQGGMSVMNHLAAEKGAA